MPILSAGTNVTLTLVDYSTVYVECKNTSVQVDAVSGLGLSAGRIAEIGSPTVFGPYVSGSVKLTATSRDIYYEQQAGVRSIAVGGTAAVATATTLGLIKGPGIAADGTLIVAAPALENRNNELRDAASWSAHTLLISGSDTTTTSIMWPWVIKTDRIASPLAKYYMYYSTDHGNGGIRMSYSNSLTSGWTLYGQVFNDPSGLGSTESPSIIWDSEDANFKMYYQNFGAKFGGSDSIGAIGIQSTLCAISTNGLAWTKDPYFIVDLPNTNTQAGDGHTGYFLPFKTKRGLFAYSLYGGTNSNTMVLWHAKGKLGGALGTNNFISNSWHSDRIGLGYGVDMTQGGELAGRAINWLSSFVVESDGTEYLISLFDNLVSGGTAKSACLVCTPISSNYKAIINRPQIIWRPTETWESVDIRTVTPFVENGILYVFYSIGKVSIGVFSHAL